MKTYEITLDGNIVGSASVVQQGLYYSIRCRCKSQKEGFCKILVTGEQGAANLGTCYPSGGEIGLEKRIPVKHIGIGKLRFQLIDCSAERKKIIPLNPSEPFAYITHLRNAHLICENGVCQIGIGRESYPATASSEMEIVNPTGQ